MPGQDVHLGEAVQQGREHAVRLDLKGLVVNGLETGQFPWVSPFFRALAPEIPETMLKSMKE